MRAQNAWESMKLVQSFCTVGPDCQRPLQEKDRGMNISHQNLKDLLAEMDYSIEQLTTAAGNQKRSDMSLARLRAAAWAMYQQTIPEPMTSSSSPVTALCPRCSQTVTVTVLIHS
jgi:hypothetical protein